MGNILHDWNEDGKRKLIAKAYAALPKGGALIAIENVIDDARRQNAFELLMSLNMLIEFGADGGFEYTGAQFDVARRRHRERRRRADGGGLDVERRREHRRKSRRPLVVEVIARLLLDRLGLVLLG